MIIFKDFSCVYDLPLPFDNSPISQLPHPALYQTVRGCFSLSTYFGIPDILVLEKYIGCPLRPKKVLNIILLKVRGVTGNDVIDFI